MCVFHGIQIKYVFQIFTILQCICLTLVSIHLAEYIELTQILMFSFIFLGYGDICPRGYKCPEGTELPLGCDAGTYQDQEGQIVCKSCPEGQFYM